MKIKLLLPEAKLPTYAHPGDAGMDVYAAERKFISRGEVVKIRLGIASELPTNTVALLFGKSGLAAKGIDVMGGVIDSGYRGEWSVVVAYHNQGHRDEMFYVDIGDKIAQVLIMPIVRPAIEVVDELSETSRGSGGFGSTGV